MDGTPVNRRRQGRYSIWSNYGVLIYTAVAFWGVLVVLNAIISDHSVRFDLTPGERFSLSQFDKRVLSGLKHNVKVMAFVRTEDASYHNLEDLLILARAYSPRISYQVIDVNKAPGMARQYGVSSYGEVIVESQGRRRDFDNARSDLLIPAILQVSNPANKHIYFTVGHGERDVFDTDRNLGFSQWRNLLTQNNYQVDNVSLFASGVPENADVVVILGPRKDFLPEELTALERYLSRSGHLIVFMDPYGSQTLADFLKKYKISFSDRVIVDPAYRLTAGEILTTQIPLRAEDNPISRSMGAPAVFSLARMVDVTGKVGDSVPGGLLLQHISKFLRSSHESWASGDLKAVTTGITEFKAGRDVKGPVAVAVEVDFAHTGNVHVPLDQMTRIVAFGSSAFAANQFIAMLGNRPLAVSVVNELAGDEILIASRERLNRAAAAAFYVTDGQARTTLILGAFVEPLLLISIGVVVFIRRRFFS